MDPQLQQSLDYIRQQLAAGQTEAAIRAGFAQSGWPQAAIDTVFAQYTQYGQANQAAQVATMQPQTSILQQAAPIGTGPANAAPTATPKRKLPKFALPALIGGVILLIIIVILVVVLQGSSGSKAANKLGQATLTGNAANNGRKNDASVLAAGVGNYVAKHSGNLPLKTAAEQNSNALLLCGLDCLPANETPVALSHYKNTPQAVSVKPYAKDLKVPDAETVYIVDNATCNGDSLGKSGQPSRAAILFALPDNAGLQQQCIGL